ncbi:hypothetical protein HGA34_02010 [Candidatus Falkowbacteria bacterium]|nr:hypothetical protein [Candidatus Falkowbacteria bacterium]
MENKLATGKINKSTQHYLDIAEIRDDTVIMKDSTMRSVLLVSSINFSLKSEDEQNAVISSYVSFLNNIDFPVQIVIQSRELDIEKYLNSLKQKEKEQTNELLKIQINDYIQYIGELISIGKIMSKRFYVVISFNPLSDKQKGFFSSMKEAFKPVNLVKMKRETFLRRRHELTRRVDNVMSGLASIGLKSVELDTQSLIELYYNTYNPVVSAHEKLVDVKKLRVTE